MAERGSLTAISQSEYETIEAAVMETARGRWFLTEFALRNRTADTRVLLDAIGRLEHAVMGERTAQNMDRVRFDLMEMAKAITRTKGEIAALQSPDHDHGRLTAASESLDAIVRTTERATSDILEAAEHVQEAAWTLRETGADESLCGELDRRATEIYTACSFQDLTAQRTSKIVHTLRYLEGRINAMIDIWGGDEGSEPTPEQTAQAASPMAQEELSQSDVDSVIIDEEVAATPAEVPLQTPAAREPAPDIAFVDMGSSVPPMPRPLQVPAAREPAPDIAFVDMDSSVPPAPSRAPAAREPVADIAFVDMDSPVAPAPLQAAAAREPVADIAFVDVDSPVPPAPMEAPAAFAPVADLEFIDMDSSDDFGFIEIPSAPESLVESPPLALAPPQPAPTMVKVTATLDSSRLDAFAEIESLDTREKLRRFT